MRKRDALTGSSRTTRQDSKTRHAASGRTRRTAVVPMVLAVLAVLGLGVAGAATLLFSPWSETVTVSTAIADDPEEEPDERSKLRAPVNVRAEAIDDETVRISWNPVKGADSYEVERDGKVLSERPSDPEYRDNGLEPDSTYTYRVRAVAGSSEPGSWSRQRRLHSDRSSADDVEAAQEKLTPPPGKDAGAEDDAPAEEKAADEKEQPEEPQSEQEKDADAQEEAEEPPSEPEPRRDPEPDYVVDCDYYAAPSRTGAGDGSSEGDAFRVADFWDVAEPGTTLCLNDGTYTGGDSMIDPPSGLSGTEDERIVVAAANDGGALIDGEGSNQPIRLADNSWFVIQGLNAANSSRDVVHLSGGANHNVLRRIVAWDANPDRNSMVYRLNGNEGNLLEDTAGFGSARKTYQASQYSNDNTFRRTWAMWNYSETSSVKQTFSVAYESLDNTCENCIGTFDADSGAYPENRRGIFSNNSMTRGGHTDGIHSNSGYWGSIAYTLADQDVSELRGQLESFRIHEGFTFENTVAYTEQSDLRTTRLRGDSGQEDKLYRRGTEIGPGGSSIDDSWDVSDRVKVDSVGDAPSIWNGSGDEGARVCHRYVDRELTDEALWPWPMNQRITDALELAGREPVDVTATMEELFGPIPDECRSS